MRETFAAANLAQKVFQEGLPKENFPGEKPAGRRGPLTDEDRSNILSHNLLGSAKARHGKRVLEYLAASLVDQHGEHVTRIPIGGQGTISLLLRANEVISNREVAVRLIDRLANTIFCACNSSLRQDLGDFSPGDEIIVSFEIHFSVDSDRYTLTLETGKQASHRPNMGIYFDVVEGIGPLTIYDPAPDQIRPFYGMAQLPCKITLR